MVCCGVCYGAVWYGYGMVWYGKYGMVCAMVSYDISVGGDLRTKYSVVNAQSVVIWHGGDSTEWYCRCMYGAVRCERNTFPALILLTFRTAM